MIDWKAGSERGLFVYLNGSGKRRNDERDQQVYGHNGWRVA